MMVKLAGKIGMQKKYLVRFNLTIRLAVETRMSGAHDVSQFIGRTYNICGTSNEPVHFGQHSREGAWNYYSIRDLHNRRFANW